MEKGKLKHIIYSCKKLIHSSCELITMLWKCLHAYKWLQSIRVWNLTFIWYIFWYISWYYLGCSNPYCCARGSKLGSASDSCVVLMCTLVGNVWCLQYLEPCYPGGRSGLYLSPLVMAWPSPSCSSHMGTEPAVGSVLYTSVCLFLLSQLKKRKKGFFEKAEFCDTTICVLPQKHKACH